jgi:formamidopyrimidine-DNA glycosylase
MPELPEVQTIINTLSNPNLFKHRITDVKVYKTKLLKNTTPAQFCRFLIGESIVKIERIGKYLIFKLTHDKILTVHLRMEGKLFNETKDSTYPSTHLRIEFFLDNQHILRYYDSRIFGTFHVYQGQTYLQAKHIQKIALDPLNERFNASYLKHQLSHSNRAIKTAILDQTNVAGIGNIYADEILFLSRIHPLKKANTLTDKQYGLVAKYARQILLKAIKYGGTTIATYQSDINHSGSFQNMLQVHDRKGEPCPICKRPIIKTKVNGRGTYFCPYCQKM